MSSVTVVYFFSTKHTDKVFRFMFQTDFFSIAAAGTAWVMPKYRKKIGLSETTFILIVRTVAYE